MYLVVNPWNNCKIHVHTFGIGTKVNIITLRQSIAKLACLFKKQQIFPNFMFDACHSLGMLILIVEVLCIHVLMITSIRDEISKKLILF